MFKHDLFPTDAEPPSLSLTRQRGRGEAETRARVRLLRNNHPVPASGARP